MRNLILIFSAAFGLWGGAFAAVNAMNGVTVSTASTILGKTPNSAVMGQTLASGGIAIVQNTKNSGSGTTVTLSISPAAGNRLVIIVLDTATFTVTDNQGTSYTATPVKTAFGVTVGMAVSATLGSGVTTVTVTPLASDTVQIIGYEVSGLSGGYTSGEYADNFFVASATWDSGSFATATAGSIIFYVAGAYTGANPTTFGTYTNGFASYGANSEFQNGSGETAESVTYKIVSATGTQSTKTTPSVSGNGVSLIAAFH